MPTIQDLESELNAEISTLESRFLRKWIPAEVDQTPEQFQHDVKAYCVLAHAAFEEFVEELSLLATKSAKTAWSEKKFSGVLIPFMMHYSSELNIPEKEETDQERITDQIRNSIDSCIALHSTALANNHGFSLKYLRNILTPIGVDIPSEVKLIASLRELSDARGSYAHTQAKSAFYGGWKKANRPMVPETAKSTVDDCLDLCMKLAKTVTSLV